MRLKSRRRARPVPLASRDQLHPRIVAIRLLRDHIADGRAGVDPYDPTVFILDAHRHETVWARRSLELCGIVLGDRELDPMVAAEAHQAGCGLSGPCDCGADKRGRVLRFRAVLEADVRRELRLDAPDAPVMADEPLASRGVAAIVNGHIDARAAPSAPVRVLTLAGGRIENPDSPAMAALDGARAAYDRRYPYGVTPDGVA